MSEFLNLGFQETIRSQDAAYSCLQRLGHGGTAETYLSLATSGSLRGQLFAIKIFRRLSKPEWRQNFLEEVRFLGNCDHPAVMRVYDEGLYLDEFPFVVAEYLPNTLGNELRKAPSMMEKMAFAVQLLSALEYLSRPEINVVHRDIKPANVFIKGGSCVLGDFGLMKRLNVSDVDMDRERLKSSVGPRMPRNHRTPDLVEYYKGGAEPTAKSDIYQLGLLFAEMFSGTNPQKPMRNDNFAEPIEMRGFFIESGMGRMIRELIDAMLGETPSTRPTAAELVPQWLEIFFEAARRSRSLQWRIL